MAYIPTNWKTGDTVTSSKLNKLEQGVAGAVNVITGTWDSNFTKITLDQTAKTIMDAFDAKIPSVIFSLAERTSGDMSNMMVISGYDYNGEEYEFYCIWVGAGTESAQTIMFYATTDSAYPTYTAE